MTDAILRVKARAFARYRERYARVRCGSFNAPVYPRAIRVPAPSDPYPPADITSGYYPDKAGPIDRQELSRGIEFPTLHSAVVFRIFEKNVVSRVYGRNNVK